MMLIREHQQFIAMPQQPSPPQQIMQQQGVHHNQQQAMPMHRQPLMQPVQLQQQWQSTSPQANRVPGVNRVPPMIGSVTKAGASTKGGSQARPDSDRPFTQPKRTVRRKSGMKDSAPINHARNRFQALSKKDQQMIEANNSEETFPPPSNEVPSRASRRRSTRAPGMWQRQRLSPETLLVDVVIKIVRIGTTLK